MFINSTAGRALYVDEKLSASSSRCGHPVPEQTPLARGTVLASCKDQNENCFFLGLLSVPGTVLLGVLLEDHDGINRAKNILSSSKNKSGRSSESLQLVGFLVVGSWWCGFVHAGAYYLLQLVLQLGSRISP